MEICIALKTTANIWHICHDNKKSTCLLILAHKCSNNFVESVKHAVRTAVFCVCRVQQTVFPSKLIPRAAILERPCRIRTGMDFYCGTMAGDCVEPVIPADPIDKNTQSGSSRNHDEFVESLSLDVQVWSHITFF